MLIFSVFQKKKQVSCSWSICSRSWKNLGNIFQHWEQYVKDTHLDSLKKTQVTCSWLKMQFYSRRNKVILASLLSVWLLWSDGNRYFIVRFDRCVQYSLAGNWTLDLPLGSAWQCKLGRCLLDSLGRCYTVLYYPIFICVVICQCRIKCICIHLYVCPAFSMWSYEIIDRRPSVLKE